MTRNLDERYFKWLYRQVCSIRQRDPSKTHWILLRQLYQREFVWLIQNDDNRAADGRALRREFVNEKRGIHVDPEWLDHGCNMLEMLIGISKRLSFVNGDYESREWFWQMIENLGLFEYNDSAPIPESKINWVLTRVLLRIYDSDGRGGLFPLRRAVGDQRRVELWYQMNEYLLETG